MQIDIKTSTIAALITASIGGITGTYAGGSRAEQKVEALERRIEERVDRIENGQSKILTEIQHLKGDQHAIKDAAMKTAEKAEERGRKIERILTILEQDGGH